MAVSLSALCFIRGGTAILPPASAQIAGQLFGTVADSGGATIPGARVTATHVLSKQSRVFETLPNGSIFHLPGTIALTATCNLHVEEAGFASYEQKDIGEVALARRTWICMRSASRSVN